MTGLRAAHDHLGRIEEIDVELVVFVSHAMETSMAGRDFVLGL